MKLVSNSISMYSSLFLYKLTLLLVSILFYFIFHSVAGTLEGWHSGTGRGLGGLFLSDLPELESLPDQLPSLNRLFVANCPKVVSIPALPNLDELMVSGCPQLERRYKRGSGEDWHKIAHVRRIVILWYNLSIFSDSV